MRESRRGAILGEEVFVGPCSFRRESTTLGVGARAPQLSNLVKAPWQRTGTRTLLHWNPQELLPTAHWVAGGSTVQQMVAVPQLFWALVRSIEGLPPNREWSGLFCHIADKRWGTEQTWPPKYRYTDAHLVRYPSEHPKICGCVECRCTPERRTHGALLCMERTYAAWKAGPKEELKRNIKKLTRYAPIWNLLATAQPKRDVIYHRVDFGQREPQA